MRLRLESKRAGGGGTASGSRESHARGRVRRRARSMRSGKRRSRGALPPRSRERGARRTSVWEPKHQPALSNRLYTGPRFEGKQLRWNPARGLRRAPSPKTGPPGLAAGRVESASGSFRDPADVGLGMVEPAARARCRGPAGPTPQERGGGVASFSRQASARSQRQPVRCHNRRTTMRATRHAGICVPSHATTRRVEIEEEKTDAGRANRGTRSAVHPPATLPRPCAPGCWGRTC